MSIVADAFDAADHAPPAALASPGAVPVAAELISGAEWDRTIGGFDDVCQEQLYAFATSRWPSVTQEPLIFRHGGEVVGGCLVMIQRLPLGIGAIAIAKWGPMLKDVDRPDAGALYLGMIEALIENYARKRRMMISIWPNADLGVRNRQYEALLARGFAPGSRLLFPNRYIVNLQVDEAAQRKSLEQKWRYHLNKADKAGLSFEHGATDRMPEFDALYHVMTGRKRFADHSAYHTVPALMGVAADELRPELFFVRHEGVVVAGAIIFKAGDRAVYLYGATNDNALPLRAGYFLHWHIIEWLREHTRARWYDLGGADGYQGLHQFKKGMVGAEGVISPVAPVANYAVHKLPFLIGTTAFAVRELVNQLRRRIELSRDGMSRPDQARHADKAETD